MCVPSSPIHFNSDTSLLGTLNTPIYRLHVKPFWSVNSSQGRRVKFHSPACIWELKIHSGTSKDVEVLDLSGHCCSIINLKNSKILSTVNNNKFNHQQIASVECNLRICIFVLPVTKFIFIPTMRLIINENNFRLNLIFEPWKRY